jgi:hypothetical protein
VKAGASLASVTVTVTANVSVNELAVAVTVTVQVFESSPDPQPGASKFGAEEKVNTPVLDTIENRSLSVPDIV